MVEKRSGRFGQAITEKEEDDPNEITPEDIAERPEIPVGRFGKSIPQTKAGQQRALELRELRNQAIEEANRLETEFFSKNITIEQSEEAFVSVDPLVRQFIRTTPQARRQRAKQTVQGIRDRIAFERQRIRDLNASKSGKTSNERDRIDQQIFRREVLIDNLGRFFDEAGSGAFSLSDIVNAAQQRTDIRVSRSEARGRVAERLVEGGLSRQEARQVLQTQRITQQQAQKLDPEVRKSLGVTPVSVRTIPAQRLDPVRVIDTERGAIKVIGEGAFDLPIEKALIQKNRLELSVQPVTAPEGFLEKKLFEVESEKAFLRTEAFRGREKQVQGVIVAAKETALETAIFLKNLRSFNINEPPSGIKEFFREPKQIPEKIITGVEAEGEIFGNELRVTPSSAFAKVAFEFLLFEGATKAIGKLTEEIIITKEPIKISEFASDTKIANIRQLEKQIDVAEFTITGIKESRKAFSVSRIELARSKILGIELPNGKTKLSQLTIKEAELRFKGNIFDLEPASVVVTKTEPFLVKDGQIIKATRRKSRGVATISLKATEDRVEPALISRLEGGLRRNARDVNKINIKQLDSISRKILKEIEKIDAPKGIEARLDFAKGTKFETGDIVSKDLAKFLKKGDIDILPTGRRTRRGELGAVQKSIASFEFERGFGLKEIEILKERIAVADITFPRFRAPKRVDLIEGTVIRKEFELPAPKEPIDIRKGRKPTRTPSQRLLRDTEVLKALEVSKAVTALKQKDLLRASSVSTKKILQQTNALSTKLDQLPLIVGGLGKVSSSFAGTGLFERTETTVFARSRTKVGNLNLLKTSAILKELSIERSLPKSVTKGITKSVTRQTPKALTKSAPKLTQKQIQKLIPRSVLKLSPKAGGRAPSLPRSPLLPTSTPLLPLPLIDIKLGQFEPKRRKGKRRRDDFALVEGFTARTLKLKPIKIPQSQLKLAIPKFQTIGLRRRPIILR